MHACAYICICTYVYVYTIDIVYRLIMIIRIHEFNVDLHVLHLAMHD